MSLDKGSLPWSMKNVAAMVRNGTINFDHVVQRSFVWEKARRSLLIDSIIQGYPISKVIAKRNPGAEGENEKGVKLSKIYYILDGKQRLSTIAEFVNDEFRLSPLEPVVFVNDKTNEEMVIDISGLKFSELPVEIQDHILTESIVVDYYDDLSPKQEREMFKRLNAGKPLTAKSKLLASCKNIEDVLTLGEHVLMGEMLSDKAKQNKDQVTVIMKTWCMLNKPIKDISFQFKVFKPVVESIELSDADKQEITKVYDYIYEMYEKLVEKENEDEGLKANKVAKKLITETHMVSLIPYIKQAIENKYKVDDMVVWVSDFYGVQGAASISEAYNQASLSGVVKPKCIESRDRALKKSFKKQFGAE